jgi:UbiD family decarboxylase
MHTTMDPPARKVAADKMPAAPKQDLRAWLAAIEAANELTIIRGAEREQEIGGIVDIYQRTPGSRAVLFDDIPGYPAGYRVLANILTSVRRINLTLGLASDATEMDLVRYWRDYMKQANTIPPPGTVRPAIGQCQQRQRH